MFAVQEIFSVINGRFIVELLKFSFGIQCFFVQNVMKRFRIGPKNSVGRVTGNQRLFV